MPVHLRQLKNRKFSVVDASGKVFAKGTTKDKAQSQMKLLNYLYYLKIKNKKNK